MATFSYGPLNRIVNVHWGGGLFVAGTEQPNTDDPPAILYSKGGAVDTWDELGPFGFDQFGKIWSGAYASVPGARSGGTPVFLLGGAADDGTEFGEFGVILRSENGKDWEEVLRMDESESAILAIVWDESEQAFYAEGSAFSHGVDGAPSTQSNTLYKSAFGESWSVADSKTHFHPVTPADEMDGLIVPHCSGKALDYRGVPVPGGVYGESGAVLIAPTNPAHVNYASGVTRNGGASTVEITRTTGGSKTVDTGIPLVSAVAYGGGTWIAAGGPGRKIARSRNNGDTWEMVYDMPDEFGGIIMTAIAK